MYEPIYLPKMKKSKLLLGGVSYAVIHTNKFKDPNSKDLDQLHMHGYTEIFFCLSSDVAFLVDGKLYSVNHGEAIVSHQNQVHVCVFNKPKNYEYFCLWINAGENFHVSSCIPQPNLLTFDGKTKEKLFSLFYRLNELSKKEQEFESSLTFLQILEIFKNNYQSNFSKEILPEFFQKIINYINDNFIEIKTVKEIADKFFISTTTLLRNFNKYLRITPKKYLEQLKLSNAVKMLNKGSTVTEACFNSGFSDVSHFIVLFKKEFKTSPFKYKTERENF